MEKNERQYTLKDNFTIDGDYEIVDWTYEPNDEKKDVPHQLIKLSRAGFNSDKDQALVHVSIGPYHTYKFYLRFYFLIKEDSAWKVESMYTTGSYLLGGNLIMISTGEIFKIEVGTEKLQNQTSK